MAASEAGRRVKETVCGGRSASPQEGVGERRALILANSVGVKGYMGVVRAAYPRRAVMLTTLLGGSRIRGIYPISV